MNAIPYSRIRFPKGIPLPTLHINSLSRGLRKGNSFALAVGSTFTNFRTALGAL